MGDFARWLALTACQAKDVISIGSVVLKSLVVVAVVVGVIVVVAVVGVAVAVAFAFVFYAHWATSL